MEIFIIKKRIFNRILITFDAVFRNFCNLIRKRNPYQKTILIVFQQVFGDAVLLQGSLAEYVRLFPKKKGYTVKLLARPSVIAFLHAIVEIPEDLQIEAVDFKRFLESYSYYKEIVRQYHGQADMLIIPGTSLSAEIFSTASDASKKIGLVRSLDVRSPLVMAFFAWIAYTERVKPEPDEMMLLRHRRLLRYLGSRDFQARLPHLLPKESIIQEAPYCVFCLGASVPEKCWPIARFAGIANYIVRTRGWKIYLCGSQEDMKCATKFLRLVHTPEYVVNYIGKTTFSHWSAIVQHASLVLGNDSATMHLAAAARVPAVCITGVYDKGQFFPYQVEDPDERICLPVALYQDMPCERCRTRGYFSGHGNSVCARTIRAGGCALCINAILEEDVRQAIERLIPADLARGGG